MKRLLYALALIATNAAADAPDPAETLEQLFALSDQGLAFEFDAALTESLRAARAEGPLDEAWASVMIVAARFLAEGRCRLPRAFALIDAVERDFANPGVKDAARAWRGYLLAQLSLWEAAAREHDGIRADNFFDASAREKMDAARAAQAPLWEAPIMGVCLDFYGIGLTRLVEGDLLGARTALRGLYMPLEYYDHHNFALILNTSALAALSLATEDAGEAQRLLDLMVSDLTVPGSEPPALRANVLENESDVVYLTEALPTVFTLDDGSPSSRARVAVVERWLEEIAAADLLPEAQSIQRQIEDARRNRDWPAILELATVLRAEEGLDPATALSLDAEIAQARTMIAVLAGEEPDLASVVELVKRAFDGELDMSYATRMAALTSLFVALEAGGAQFSSYETGREMWKLQRIISRAAGEGRDGGSLDLGQYAPVYEVVIATGFDVAAQPPDGAPAPPGLCQDVFGTEVCTILVALP